MVLNPGEASPACSKVIQALGGDKALPTTREAEVCRVLEEARSGCSTIKSQEKLDQFEADQKEAQTVMEPKSPTLSTNLK